jgi:hypothetical protein
MLSLDWGNMAIYAGNICRQYMQAIYAGNSGFKGNHGLIEGNIG